MSNKKSFLQNMLCVFFAAFPLIEIYRTFLGDTISLCGIAIEELAVMLIAGAVFIGAMIVSFSEKRYKIIIFAAAYYLIFAIYLILHGLNTLKFNAAILPESTPNFIIESYYLIRVYALPISVIFSALALEIPRKKIMLAIKAVAFEISLCIIITDLAGISFISYSDELKRISGSFFSWFSLGEDAKFAFYTAKGFFLSANAIGALMFAISPFILYSAASGKKISSKIAASLLALSMIMLGTKIAGVGFILSAAAVIIALLFCGIIKKDAKKRISGILFIIAILVIYIPLLLLSPGYKMQRSNYTLKETEHRESNTASIDHIVNSDKSEEKEWSEEEITALEKYMEEKHYYHYVNEWFLEIYPVRGDMDFWINIVTRDNSLNISNRAFKTDMVKRICERNNNKKDLLFGMGYTSSVPYTERDYVYQFYLYGICGMAVFILPYFGIMIYGIYIFLKKISKGGAEWLCAPIIAIGCYLFTAYFAGHTFDILINMYFISLIAASFFIAEGKEDEK